MYLNGRGDFFTYYMCVCFVSSNFRLIHNFSVARSGSSDFKMATRSNAYKLAISSTKSMTGHLLGAAGGIEAIFSLLSIYKGVIPPTINLENPSEGCDLDYVPNTAREADVDVAISNSFGFGGTNGSLVFRKFSD